MLLNVLRTIRLIRDWEKGGGGGQGVWGGGGDIDGGWDGDGMRGFACYDAPCTHVHLSDRVQFSFYPKDRAFTPVPCVGGGWGVEEHSQDRNPTL